MRTIQVIFLIATSAGAQLSAALTPDQIVKTMPAAEVEKALPQEHPSAYHMYAGRLFSEGKKDEAVFWYYVGQLRYRFHLKANPNLDPSGDPALFSSLNATLGEQINGYAGGNIKDWVQTMDRALKWDDDSENGFTSKKQYKEIYEANRAGLKKMREQVVSQADYIREERKKIGLENRE